MTHCNPFYRCECGRFEWSTYAIVLACITGAATGSPFPGTGIFFLAGVLAVGWAAFNHAAIFAATGYVAAWAAMLTWIETGAPGYALVAGVTVIAFGILAQLFWRGILQAIGRTCQRAVCRRQTLPVIRVGGIRHTPHRARAFPGRTIIDTVTNPAATRTGWPPPAPETRSLPHARPDRSIRGARQGARARRRRIASTGARQPTQR